MLNLASTLYAEGDLAKARELEEQVLAASRRLLGEEHPDTLNDVRACSATPARADFCCGSPGDPLCPLGLRSALLRPALEGGRWTRSRAVLLPYGHYFDLDAAIPEGDFLCFRVLRDCRGMV